MGHLKRIGSSIESVFPYLALRKMKPSNSYRAFKVI